MIELAGAFGAGTIILIGPTAVAFGRDFYAAGFLYLIRVAVERMSSQSFVHLILLGIALGIVCRTSVTLLSPAAVLIFPLWSVIDFAAGGGVGHGMLAFEWAFYVFYAILVLGGALVGRLARKFWLRRKAA